MLLDCIFNYLENDPNPLIFQILKQKGINRKERGCKWEYIEGVVTFDNLQPAMCQKVIYLRGWNSTHDNRSYRVKLEDKDLYLDLLKTWADAEDVYLIIRDLDKNILFERKRHTKKEKVKLLKTKK